VLNFNYNTGIDGDGMVNMINNIVKINQKLFTAIRTGFPKPVIVDQFTGLPTLISFMPHLIRALAKGRVALIYIDIENFTGVEALYGRNLCSQILLNVGNALKQLNTGILNDNNKLGVCSMGGDDFLIFIKSSPQMDYEEVCLNLKEDIENSINQANSHLELNSKLCIHLEYAQVQEIPGCNPESIIYSAIKRASYGAKRFANLEEQAHRYLLNQVLDDEMINIVYQPIVSLRSGSILGYEALTRGPQKTYFESPENLFNAAEEFQCLFELESLSHKLAAQNASSQLGDRYLFLNVNPLVLNAANHKKGQTRAILREYGVDCSNYS
jgi:predicted signal transduction protein with EAL and GGDEF domain